jgi:hypothetical protein
VNALHKVIWNALHKVISQPIVGDQLTVEHVLLLADLQLLADLNTPVLLCPQQMGHICELFQNPVYAICYGVQFPPKFKFAFSTHKFAFSTHKFAFSTHKFIFSTHKFAFSTHKFAFSTHKFAFSTRKFAFSTHKFVF